LHDEVLRSEEVRLEDGSTWEQRISFTPNQLGALLKLEFLLFKDRVEEKPYKSFYLLVSSDIDYDHLEVLKDIVISPLPAIINSEIVSMEGWAYVETDVNFTGAVSNFTSVSPWYSYEISYPAQTPFDSECYAGIYQNFTTERYPATVVIAFNARDSYAGEREGFMKQVLLNDEVIWEDSVAGDERWQHTNVPVTLRTKTNKLTLRVKGERSNSDFPVQVWWDDVRIEPIRAVAEKPTAFYVRDAQGTEKNYPTALHLGESAEFIVGIENKEHKAINYIIQVKLDGREIKRENKWLEHGSTWEQRLSFTPDKVGENQKLEFLLFKDSVGEKPYRYFRLFVSTDLNYANLEPLLRCGIEPLPVVMEGDMSQISSWIYDGEGNFQGALYTENTSSPYSYGMDQYGASNKGDYGELGQNIYASDEGVVVLSFNVRDSYEETSDEARKIIKQVLLNDKVVWSDDISGSDAGYMGWVEEEFVGPYGIWNEYIKSHDGFLEFEEAKYEALDWWIDEWIERKVPRVQSGWTHVDVPVYLHAGNNKLGLRVFAEDAAEDHHAKVYWDDVELKGIHELVKVDERVRMKRYGW
jgi:hypothetical protein